VDAGAGQLAVLYDSDCGFCKWALDKILAWDRHRRLRPVAIQSEEGQTLLADVAPDRRLDSWHLVGEGEVRSGGAAAPALFRELPAGRPLAATLRTFPRATDRAYRWVADHRDLLARMLGIDSSCTLRR
jgi:predicted DCC family thiol-disulfide oxidoreductase YuxK